MRLESIQYWTQVALLNFIIASLAGLLMRYAFFGDLNVLVFKDLLQAHSHLAMLGWVFLILTLLISYCFKIESLQWNRLLVFTQLAVIGMFISLLLVGYRSVSIVFLSFHMILTGIILWIILRGRNEKSEKSFDSNLWLKTAIFFLFLSFLGPVFLGPLSAFEMNGTAWYYAAIQFFLHFQFNGWMIFGILALLFKFFESKQIETPKILVQRFYICLIISCFLTYALAIAWSNPYMSVFVINSVGVIIQFVALILFWILILKTGEQIKAKLSKPIFWLFFLSLLMLTAKIGIQSLIVFPFVAKIAYTIRFFVIGFMHLILLGVVSFAILAFLYEFKILKYQNITNKFGVKCFASGFILSETWMFIQGIFLWAKKGFIPNFHELLFGFSFLMPIGLISIMIANYSIRKKISNKLSIQRLHINK